MLDTKPMNDYQGEEPVNQSMPFQHQQIGTSQTRVRMSGAWHAGHITMTILTGGLWGFVYLAKYLKNTSRRTETRHY